MRTTVLCVTMLMLLGATAMAQTGESDRTISVPGEAAVYVAPDEVVIVLGVETWNRDLEESQAANARSCAQLLKAIKELGVEDKHIQTEVMNVQIDYANGEAKNGIDGYFCRRGYQVTLKDTKLFEKLINTALQNGANHLVGFEFRTSELRKHRDEARKMAIKAAREKAEALAGELGARIGKPRNIREQGGGYEGYQSGWWGWRGGGMSLNRAAYQGGGGEGGETMPLGQIAIRAQVNVTFDLVVE